MENKSNKGTKVLLTLILIFMLCSLSVSAVTLVSQMQMKTDVATVKTAMRTSVDTGEEDNVVIADEYTIRSTTQISDAYKNGTEDSLSDADKETLDMAKAVLEEIITDDMTPFEKEKAVYLWLTTEMKSDTGILTVIPTSPDNVDNPHGVLKSHNAVCVGYATTFRLFMQMMDIECKVIHSDDLIHSWDLVKLDDEWYHVDCYSDSGDGNFRNFNMNDTIAENSHEWNHQYFPAATGETYTYAAMNSVEIKNIYAIPQFVRNMLDNDESVAACTFKKKIKKEEEDAAAVLVSRLMDRLNEAPDFYIDSAWSTNADGDYILNIYIVHYGEEENRNLDEKTEAKIESVIEKAFSDYEFESYDVYGDNFGTTSVAVG